MQLSMDFFKILCSQKTILFEKVISTLLKCTSRNYYDKVGSGSYFVIRVRWWGWCLSGGNHDEEHSPYIG